jgi:hypothetical protein
MLFATSNEAYTYLIASNRYWSRYLVWVLVAPESNLHDESLSLAIGAFFYMLDKQPALPILIHILKVHQAG